MFSKKLILPILLFFVTLSAQSQDCKLSVTGEVVDEVSGFPLSYVNVIIQELSRGMTTDESGHFLFEDICEGEYHLILSHIGCAPIKIHLDLFRDTLLNIAFPHTATSLDDIVVKGKKNNHSNQSNLSVNRQAIEDNANQNLSGLLEKETGVHLIKNGSGISKPVVHGLYGNRLVILNNGIAQSGQQWGNDHSPEIDPFSADKITVLKGANAIAYGGGNLGSVILVEPKKIGREPHLHGQINYAYETNGRGNTLNARLEKYSPFLAWRINGSVKKYGDRKTADYFLNNTGVEELNFAVQLEKSWKEKLFLEVYASTFNTRLGMLRGAHIGNLTDLDQALIREIPFFTEPNFSYTIEAPKQEVSHHLVKLKSKYYLEGNQSLELVMAGQLNDRKEFDVRRSGRTDLPALNLRQYTLNSELKYAIDFEHNWKLQIGNQNIITDNTNNPETGILPLIPDYISWKNGTFVALSKQKEKTNISLGIRYDYEYQNVAAISNSIPRVVIRFENNFLNVGGVFGLKYDWSTTQSITLNTGYAMRNPAINELYSNGLHQGVSGIEEGDVNLNTEKAIKNTLEYKWLPTTNFSLSALAYYQYFEDYIFLNPQDEIRLTIRGAFPIFKYEQTNASIYGLDISTQFTLSNSLFGLLKYSFIKGRDLKNNIPLVFMPPNSLFGSLTYRSKKALKLSNKINLEELEFEINNRLVLEQKNLLAGQDFVLPPPTYNLFGLKVSTNIISPNHKFRFFTKVDNVFNVKYRDYLNRQRYFADDTGISITFGVNFKF
ncbi:MAG: iron complex outermembrane receptor protein [Polaribacter sp.]|jgi:iron complex outermembrane receptor protein